MILAKAQGEETGLSAVIERVLAICGLPWYQNIKRTLPQETLNES